MPIRVVLLKMSDGCECKTATGSGWAKGCPVTSCSLSCSLDCHRDLTWTMLLTVSHLWSRCSPSLCVHLLKWDALILLPCVVNYISWAVSFGKCALEKCVWLHKQLLQHIIHLLWDKLLIKIKSKMTWMFLFKKQFVQGAPYFWIYFPHTLIF